MVFKAWIKVRFVNLNKKETELIWFGKIWAAWVTGPSVLYSHSAVKSLICWSVQVFNQAFSQLRVITNVELNLFRKKIITALSGLTCGVLCVGLDPLLQMVHSSASFNSFDKAWPLYSGLHSFGSHIVSNCITPCYSGHLLHIHPSKSSVVSQQVVLTSRHRGGPTFAAC